MIRRRYCRESDDVNNTISIVDTLYKCLDDLNNDGSGDPVFWKKKNQMIITPDGMRKFFITIDPIRDVCFISYLEESNVESYPIVWAEEKVNVAALSASLDENKFYFIELNGDWLIVQRLIKQKPIKFSGNIEDIKKLKELLLG